MISTAAAQRGSAAVPALVPAPVRLGQDTARLRAEVRGAAVVARIAHQVHGAIGFTAEHPLHLVMTRLWAWRDEAGDEAEWAGELGDRALAAGADGLWPLLANAG